MKRTEIVTAAREWLGTPYHHQASLSGVGCDCLGLVRGLWRELCGPEPELPPPYSPNWAESLGQETLALAALRHLVPVALAQVRPGDVLFLARGNRPVAAAVIESMEDAFLSSFFFLVRPNEKLVRPRYLAWSINVPLRSQVAVLMQGSHVPQVSIADFGELMIDLPSLAVQDRIVALDELGRREKRLAEEVARRRAELVRLACVQASRQGREGGGA